MESLRKNKELSDDACIAACSEMLAVSVNMKLPRGTYAKVADKYGVSERTMESIWSKRAAGDTVEDVMCALRSKKPGNRGGPRIDEDALNEALRNTPLRKRKTFRHASASTGYPRSTIHRALQRGELRRKKSTLKPIVTDKNKIARLKWCLNFIDERIKAFHSMYNYVHLYEKWFYLTKTSESYLLSKDD